MSLHAIVFFRDVKQQKNLATNPRYTAFLSVAAKQLSKLAVESKYNQSYH